MLNDLLLLSGNDIPFFQAQVIVHQPTLKEIAYIGEDIFFQGCELLNFSKDVLEEEVKISLVDKTNFDVLMSIIVDKTTQSRNSRKAVMDLLSLLFPNYQLSIGKDGFYLIQTFEDMENRYSINNDNFEIFKQIIREIFCLERKKDDTTAYNPGNTRAAEIAKKLRKGREKAAAARNESQKISILSRYASILAVGEQKDLNSLMNYTVYQLYDEFQRFELKQNFDIYLQAKMAGAKDMEEVDNWMKDLHP